MSFEVTNKTGASLMRTELTAQDLQTETFRTDYIDITLPFGTVKATEWYFDGIKMTHSESEFNHPLVLDWKGDTEMITMCFNLKGKLSILNGNMPQAFELSANQHNMFYGKEAEGKMKVDELKMRSFLIQFSKEAFFEMASEGNDALKRFADQVASGRSMALSSNNLNIDLNLQHSIDAVLRCKYAEPLKRMFFFSKAIEMLVLQAELFDQSVPGNTLYIKKEYDRERILFARDYLVKHLEFPPTLTELAKIAGINEFKLKRGFKEVFGLTAFEYLSEVRLDMARTALSDKRKSISEIAFDLGYSSLQHFSAAFKKKFGVSPRHI